MTTESSTFQETQYFRNPLIFILLFAIFGIAIWGIVQQLILNVPFGNNPAPDYILILFSMIPVIFLLFFIFMKQKTVIDKESIQVTISPFGRRRMLWANIEKAYIRTYKPIMEYGGWGIRYGFAGKGVAYSVGGGNQGLQLELKNGQKVLIGTKKADALKSFLTKEGLLNGQL